MNSSQCNCHTTGEKFIVPAYLNLSISPFKICCDCDLSLSGKTEIDELKERIEALEKQVKGLSDIQIFKCAVCQGNGSYWGIDCAKMICRTCGGKGKVRI